MGPKDLLLSEFRVECIGAQKAYKEARAGWNDGFTDLGRLQGLPSRSIGLDNEIVYRAGCPEPINVLARDSLDLPLGQPPGNNGDMAVPAHRCKDGVGW